jgi:hypothetical protein
VFKELDIVKTLVPTESYGRSWPAGTTGTIVDVVAGNAFLVETRLGDTDFEILGATGDQLELADVAPVDLSAAA